MKANPNALDNRKSARKEFFRNRRKNGSKITFGGNPKAHLNDIVVVTPTKVLVIPKPIPKPIFESYRCGYCATDGFRSETALYAHLQSAHIGRKRRLAS